MKTILKENDEESEISENSVEQSCTPCSAEETLALIEDVKLSNYQYNYSDAS